MLQQERMAIVDALVADIPTTDKEQLRRYLYGLSNEELQKTATAYQTVHTEAVRAAEQHPQVIEAQQRLRAATEKLAWSNIFFTVIDGKVAVDNLAARSVINSWRNLDEEISPAWYKQVLAQNPALMKSLTWQSAKVLDPKFQKQAAAAQDQQDRETFEAFAKSNGFSEVAANFHLAKSVLGSGFDQTALTRAVQSGQLQLALASEETLAERQREAAEEHQDFLIHRASPEEGREAARQEAEQNRAEFQRAEQERQIYGREVADQAFGFPSLPEIHQPTGEKIDGAWLYKISNTNLPLFKALMRKHGAAALTRRLNGRG